MFVDHIVLMISNVKRTKEFYSKFLGTPDSEEKESISYIVGDTKIFLGLPYKDVESNKFNPDRIGLNHLAFGVKTSKELKELGKKLDKAKIKNSGIKIDKHGKKEYIWFDDPDKIRLEFYLREK